MSAFERLRLTGRDVPRPLAPRSRVSGTRAGDRWRGESSREGNRRYLLISPTQLLAGIGEGGGVASPLVVFERIEVSSVAGSLLFGEASEMATAGPQGPM